MTLGVDSAHLVEVLIVASRTRAAMLGGRRRGATLPLLTPFLAPPLPQQARQGGSSSSAAAAMASHITRAKTHFFKNDSLQQVLGWQLCGSLGPGVVELLGCAGELRAAQQLAAGALC